MPIDPELEEVLAETTDSLKSSPETLGVVFHGSFLRGDHHPESDIDILCITDADWLSLETRDVSGYKVEIQRNPIRKVRHDVHRPHPGNNNFHLTALITGKVLFDRDGAISQLLREAREIWKQGPPAAKPLEIELCRSSLRNRRKALRQLQDDPQAEGLLRVLADVLFYRAIHDYCKIHGRWCMKFSHLLQDLEKEAPEIHHLCRSFLQARTGPQWLEAIEAVTDAVMEPVGWGPSYFDTGRQPMGARLDAS